MGLKADEPKLFTWADLTRANTNDRVSTCAYTAGEAVDRQNHDRMLARTDETIFMK